MTVPRIQRTPWPRIRLRLRSIISSTMVIGWIWVAASALIPYFLVSRGQGAGGIEVLGLTRSTWMSMHVWSSITVGLLTIGHALLNRKGLYRSVRILSGTPAVARDRSAGAGRPKRGFAWIAALVVVVIVTAGSVAFAAVDDHGPASAESRIAGGVGRGAENTTKIVHDSDDQSVWKSVTGPADHEQIGGGGTDRSSDSSDRQRRQRGGA